MALSKRLEKCLKKIFLLISVESLRSGLKVFFLVNNKKRFKTEIISKLKINKKFIISLKIIIIH